MVTVNVFVVFLLFHMMLRLDWMGIPSLNKQGLSPKLISDYLDDMSFLVTLSGALGGSMLKLLDNYM
jgi:hypothetical protein